eukprot:IDg8011t1
MEIGKHRAIFVTSFNLNFFDESMSRWLRLGEDWIYVGLPMYRAIDRKLEDKYKIKESAYDRRGAIILLKLVKYPTDDADHEEVTRISYETAVSVNVQE